MILIVCLGLLVSLGVALWQGGPAVETWALIASVLITFDAGLLLRYLPRRGGEERFGNREAFAVVTFGWISVALFGALPFYLSGVTATYTDAFFETMSGFTTTGATILIDIESVPKGMLFWRSLTHWFGGMGIVVLSVAILPSLGAGGFQLFMAEMPGIKGEKLRPRIAETAKLLWKVYLLLTCSQVALLLIGDMPLFDSICHAFGTVATAGFSTKNASIGNETAYIQWVITAFMFLAGINFVLHFKLMTGRFRSFLQDAEFRAYFAICVLATATIALMTLTGKWQDLPRVVRESAFTVTAISTTTGYTVTDFDVWPNLARIMLLLLMVVGACAGSTSGGLKIIRIMLLWKYAWRELKRLVRPRAVIALRFGKHTVEESAMAGILGILVLYVFTFAIASVIMATLMGGNDPSGRGTETAITSVIAALGNIGPGLGGVGPAHNYSWVPDAGKWTLSLCMLLGRLEFYSVLILIVPLTWRR